MSEGEVLKQPEPAQEMEPKSLEEVISSLKGFGIEEFEEILEIDASGKKVRLRISNIPSEDEMTSLLAAEGHKGYLWVQRVKCEILSRAISWIDGVPVRNLKGKQRLVKDPTDDQQRDIQVVLRNLLLGWGQEILNILWKVVCVHSQRIEDRLAASFPDAAVMTEVEKRFLEQAMKDIAEMNKAVITEQFDQLIDEAAKEEKEEQSQQE